MDINAFEKQIEKQANELVEKKEASAVLQTPEMNFDKPSEKSYVDQAKDFVGMLATQKAVQDEKLVDDITEKKKEELKHNAEAHLKSEKAESKQADIKLQEADYGVYSGIATYAGIKKPLPNKFQRFLFLILICIQAPFLLIFGGITSAINIICDCVNSIVEKLSSIAKSARILVLSLLILGSIALVVYIIFSLLTHYNVI
jgi:hypothetical protein